MEKDSRVYDVLFAACRRWGGKRVLLVIEDTWASRDSQIDLCAPQWLINLAGLDVMAEVDQQHVLREWIVHNYDYLVWKQRDGAAGSAEHPPCLYVDVDEEAKAAGVPVDEYRLLDH